jgi:peptidoglycan/xylan/chitin deacetylase (PgdA/CDA1 family)
MYHAFGEEGENASRYVLPIQKFKAQMWLLRHLGFQVISLDEYLNCLGAYHLPPEKAVVLTIDDGYEDNYSLAFPVLKHFGLAATIFLVSDYMGATNGWDQDSVLTGRPLLDQQEAIEMRNSGISFGAHTCTHPLLTKLSEREIWEEISQSKLDLEQSLGIPIRLFSYPYGDYDTKVAAAVKEAGMEGACTVKTGLNTFETSVFGLRRTEIFGTFSLWRFLRAVSSGT